MGESEVCHFFRAAASSASCCASSLTASTMPTMAVSTGRSLHSAALRAELPVTTSTVSRKPPLPLPVALPRLPGRRGHRGLADGQHVFERLVRPRDHVDRNQLAHAPCRRRARIGSRFHSSHIAADQRGNVARADLLPAHQRHLGRLDHSVRGLDHRYQAARLDHSECFTHSGSSIHCSGRRPDRENSHRRSYGGRENEILKLQIMRHAEGSDASLTEIPSGRASRFANQRSLFYRRARSLRTASSISASSSSRVRVTQLPGPAPSESDVSEVTGHSGPTCDAVAEPYRARAACNFSTSPLESKTCLPSSSVTRVTWAKCSTVSIREKALSRSAP